MIFVLIYFCFSQHILDLTTDPEPRSLWLSIHPLDNVQIKIPKGLGTFFSQWKSNKDLKLDVDAENSDGNLITYKSFDTYVDLHGIVFQTRSYYLKFFNDGDATINIPMMFSRNFTIEKNDFYNYYSFNRHEQSESIYGNDFNVLSSPFMISNSEVTSIAILFPVCVMIFYFFSAIICMRYPCYKCF